MAAINKVILIGSTGKNIELRYTPGGQAVGQVSLAVTEKRTDKNGDKQEKTEWINLVLFGKTAENAAKYVGKGSTIYIEGKIQTRNWEKDGTKHYKTEVVVMTMQFLVTKNPDGSTNPVGRQAQEQDFDQTPPQEDLPF